MEPTLLEVVTDPEVPPLPPHLKGEQAKHPQRRLTRQADE
jgi:pyruvate dehydrogenase (quinone)